ncbi:MAG: CD1375 family protein [Prevotella sp.]
MAQFLAIQIKLGKLTIDNVPAKWQAAVQAILDAPE